MAGGNCFWLALRLDVVQEACLCSGMIAVCHSCGYTEDGVQQRC